MTTIKDYEHIQETAESIWNINHKLNTNSPVIDVFVEVGGFFQKILPLSVDVVGPSTCQVKFSVPRSGKARIM